jgi:hypothetical protein
VVYDVGKGGQEPGDVSKLAGESGPKKHNSHLFTELHGVMFGLRLSAVTVPLKWCGICPATQRYATSQKVAGLISDEVIEFIQFT